MVKGSLGSHLPASEIFYNHYRFYVEKGHLPHKDKEDVFYIAVLMKNS